MLSLVLIKTRNAAIPTMKIHQIEYQTGFLNSTRWKIRCSLNPKAQVVNKVQRQLRPEPYLPKFFKSRAQIVIKFAVVLLIEITSRDIKSSAGKQ